MIHPFLLLVSTVIGYTIGSIPSGFIFTRLSGLGDIRDIGSGNTGATNVLRTGNHKIAAYTFLCDTLKGLLVLIIFSNQNEDLGIISAFFSFLGHVFPIWLRFKGGKGVATYLGILIGIGLPYGLIFILTWVLIALISRYSSLSSLIAVIVTLFIAFFHLSSIPLISISLMSLIILFKHSPNIQRMHKGIENKI
jgi:glycerol-3-phosphate acyltransferase PlsY